MRQLLILTCLLGVACASATPAPLPRVERTSEEIDLSGEWNDVDADRVAKALIEKLSASPWVKSLDGQSPKPVVRLYPIRNRTDRYIDTLYFTKQVEAMLVQSGKVDVVSSLDEADTIRSEREDQAVNASDETAKSHGNEAGSDFVMNGYLVTQKDSGGGQTVNAYMATLEITSTETNRKAWVGQHRVKKLVREETDSKE